MYIYLTFVSCAGKANNFPGPSKVCPGFVRTIFFLWALFCKTSGLHLVFAFVARKGGKGKTTQVHKPCATSCLCCLTQRLWDSPKQGLISSKLWPLTIPSGLEMPTLQERKVLQSIHSPKSQHTCPARHSLMSVKISTVANGLLELEKSTINTFTNICPSITPQNKIPGKTVGNKTLMDKGRMPFQWNPRILV